MLLLLFNVKAVGCP